MKNIPFKIKNKIIDIKAIVIRMISFLLNSLFVRNHMNLTKQLLAKINIIFDKYNDYKIRLDLFFIVKIENKNSF